MASFKTTVHHAVFMLFDKDPPIANLLFKSIIAAKYMKPFFISKYLVSIAQTWVNGRIFRQFVNIVFKFEIYNVEPKRKQALLRSNLPGIGSPDKVSQ